jgi:cardiolipin synthase
MVDRTPAHVPSANGGPYPVREGNTVTPLIDGVPAFVRIAEAVDRARHSVWVTVAFFNHDFRVTGGRDFFTLLDAAAARGLDVRVIFWRPNSGKTNFQFTFSGSEQDHGFLAERDVRFRIRWDRAPRDYAHHQKCWLIDAGRETEVAFVGGVNVADLACGSPGHRREHERHDIFAEIRGPCVTDAHHNFVQRWNGATERNKDDGIWCHGSDDVMAPPTYVSQPCGTMTAQMQRMMPADHYDGTTPLPEGGLSDLTQGETTLLEQYRLAIRAARRSIYI